MKLTGNKFAKPCTIPVFFTCVMHLSVKYLMVKSSACLLQEALHKIPTLFCWTNQQLFLMCATNLRYYTYLANLRMSDKKLFFLPHTTCKLCWARPICYGLSIKKKS